MAAADREQPEVEQAEPAIPLVLVTRACPSLTDYAEGEIRNWRDLTGTMERVRPWMGISPDAWQSAKDEMGPEVAATVAACILERADRITSPGGYLRALTRKAAEGSFSPGPMVMALLNANPPDRVAS